MAHNSVNVVGKINAEITGGFSKGVSFQNRIGTLEAGGSRTILDTDFPFIIDYLEWSCNNPTDIRVEILAKTDTNPGGIAITRTTDKRGTSLKTYLTAEAILEHRAGMWDILDYDENANAFKFRLNKELEFAKGLSISIYNIGEESKNAAIMMYGRELR